MVQKSNDNSLDSSLEGVDSGDSSLSFGLLRRYHTAFAPLIDVFALGGPLVFSELSAKRSGQKNLIVISDQTAKEMEHPRGDSYRIAGVGGKHALRQLKTKPHFVGDGLVVYNFSEGLDVMVDHNGHSVSESLKKLENFTDKLKVLTRDSYCHLRNNFHGIDVETPEFLLANADIVEEGVVEGNDLLLTRIYENNGSLNIEDSADLLDREELYQNQFVRFRTEKGSLFAKVNGDLVRNNKSAVVMDLQNLRLDLLSELEYSKKLSVGNHVRERILNVKPLDFEQYLVSQYGILNRDVEIAFISGVAGSGKTLLSYVLGVDQILLYDKEIARLRGLSDGEQSFYKNMILLKPNNIMGGSGRDLGFLPGTLWEKQEPHLMPFRDAHRESSLDDIIGFEGMFLDSRRPNKYGGKRETPKINKEAYLPQKEPIELVSSGHLRGVSFKNSLVLIDEAQNFTPYEMKTILSRGGLGTKFIIMGDPEQFDNPFCSPDLNGFTSSIQYYLPKPHSLLIKLPRSYRGSVARDALDMPVYSR
jgi:predicted ribonuclease YlaK